jgi:probable F420-dependent oxidoreductase
VVGAVAEAACAHDAGAKVAVFETATRSLRMQLGVFTFNTEYTMPADKLAIAAEQRGFESLWVPEHSHIPVPADAQARYPDGNLLPREYKHMADPWVSLAAAAAVTTTIKLGTGICLVNEHNPINLAKAVATVDVLSNGRVIFGAGAGWNVREMNDHGVQFEDRWPQLVDRLAAMKALWTQDQASHRGKFVEFGPLWSYPKPVQRPHPPILLGTLDTPFGRAQVAKHGDGWLPLTFDVDRTRASIDDVKNRMRALGRDPAKLEISLFFLDAKDQHRDALLKAVDTGAGRAILRLATEDPTTVLKQLDRYAALLPALR